MELAYMLGGGAPVIKRYMAGTTISTAGIPVLGAVDAATDLGSVEPTTASTAVNVGSQVGLCLDTSGTIAATGITDGSLLEGVRFTRQAIFTHSVVMRASTRTVRWIRTEHPDTSKFE